MLKYSECITFKVQSSHVPNDSVSVLDFEMCIEILVIVYSTHSLLKTFHLVFKTFIPLVLQKRGK